MRHMHYKGIRIPVFILSILINALGIDLIIVAGFGSSPISSVPIVISLYSNWTFGQITFFANILFIAAQIALLRRQFHPIEALQLGISVIFSVALDLYMPLLSVLQGHSWPLAGVILLIGCAVLAFGICLEVASQVLMVPGDGIVKAIAQTANIRMGTAKVAFDSTLVAMALGLSLFYGGAQTFAAIGVGTIVSAMAVGRLVNFFNRRLFFIERLARLSLEDQNESPVALAKEAS